jgi:hypothetical protein
LPFCLQLRFDIGVGNWVVGGTILAVALVFAAPALSIRWWAAPEENMTLRTRGIYGIVRNPIYLADILFSLGFAIMFRSFIGVALVPLWWAGFLFIVLTEKESLERVLGQPYSEYNQRVKGRIIPKLLVVDESAKLMEALSWAPSAKRMLQEWGDQFQAPVDLLSRHGRRPGHGHSERLAILYDLSQTLRELVAVLGDRLCP